MTRRHLVSLFAAGLLELCAVASGHGQPAPCGPGVSLLGPPALTADLRERLSARGVGAPTAGCGAVGVAIFPVESGLSLEIRDGARQSRRTVADLEVAAALVESWARTDIAGSLMLASPPQAAEPHTLAPEVRMVAAPPGRSLAVEAAATTSFGSDGSVWLGAQLAGCVHLGGVCVGAVARFAQDTGTSGNTEATEATRRGAELLLAADRPYRLGRGFISPGVGLGVNWMRSLARGPSTRVDLESGGPLAHAHLVFGIPLTSRVALDLGLSLDLAPLAHTSDFHSEGATFPGEPRGYLRVVLGLRYGEP